MSTSADDLWGLIRRFGSGTEREQQHAEQALIARAKEAVPMLILEVEEELQRSRDLEWVNRSQVARYDTFLHRLAMLLARMEDVRAASVLARVAHLGFQTDNLYNTTGAMNFYLPLSNFLIALESRVEREDIAALLHLLTTVPRKQELNVLRVIVALAERDPVPELQSALILIRPRFGELEKMILRRRLYKALLQSSLPIPVIYPASAENLPQPSQQGVSGD